MPAPHKSPTKVVAIILYGVVAGFAVTAIIVVGPVFLGLLAGWIFKQIGWEQASRFAEISGFYFFYFTVVIGVIAGLIICLYVWITRLRSAPTP
jgi:MFS family permease